MVNLAGRCHGGVMPSLGCSASQLFACLGERPTQAGRFGQNSRNNRLQNP